MTSNTFSPNERTSFFGVDRPNAPDHAGGKIAQEVLAGLIERITY